MSKIPRLVARLSNVNSEIYLGTTTAEDWALGTGWIQATNTIPYILGAPITGVSPYDINLPSLVSDLPV